MTDTPDLRRQQRFIADDTYPSGGHWETVPPEPALPELLESTKDHVMTDEYPPCNCAATQDAHFFCHGDECQYKRAVVARYVAASGDSRGGAQPPSQFEAWVIEAARQILAEIALEKPRLRTSRIAEIIQAARGGAQPEADERAITFDDFAVMNRMRCEAPNGFNHRMDSWSTSDWFTAILGELGEAANIAKKLNRVRDGIRGNKETEELLHAKLRQELGDTFVYLDLAAQSLGFTIGAAAMEVFNAKSKELGYVARAVSSPAPTITVSHGAPPGIADPSWVTGNEGKDGRIPDNRDAGSSGNSVGDCANKPPAPLASPAAPTKR